MINNIEHLEQLNPTKVRLISFISFLLGFSASIVVYILSTYFQELSGSDNVGIFYTLAYFLILINLLNLHKLVRWLGKAVVFYIAVIAMIVVTVAILMVSNPYLIIALLILFLLLGNLSMVSVNTILETFSVDSRSGRIKGMQLTIMNAGFIFGPIISTKLLAEYGYPGVFFVTLVIYMLVFVLGIIGIRHINHKFEQKMSVIDVLKKATARKNILYIYAISFVLEFFYTLMVVFVPIYLRGLGISWEDIGIAFTIMLVPFIILQYPAGVMADKKLGEKEMIIISLLIMLFATLVVFYTKSTSAIVWGLVLFATRVGAALIEVLRDSYFYKKIDARDVDMINFFNTARPVGYIVASLISIAIIGLFSVEYVFLLIVLVTFLALYPAFKLVDNKSEKELKEVI